MDERVPVYPMPNANDNVFAITRHHMRDNGVTESRERLVDVHSRGSLFKKRYFYRNISIALVLVIIILLIIVVIISCYYASTWKKLKKTSPMCTSEDCLRSASNLRLSMDLSADPCDDFYKFTCGKWSEEHINHGWYSKFSNFETIDEKISVAAIHFFESNNSLKEPLPVNQSRDFYKSCMDVGSINKMGYTLIFKYLKEVKLPDVPSFFTIPQENAAKFKFDWIAADVNIKKVFAMDLFIQFTVDADIYNRSNNVMYLGSSRSKSPLPSPLKQKKNKGARRQSNVDSWSWKRKSSSEAEEDIEELYTKAYKRVIKEVLRVLSANSTKLDGALVDKAVDILWNMTSEISELAGEDDDEEDEGDYYDVRKIKAKDLQNLTNVLLVKSGEKTIDVWETYLMLLYKGVDNVKLDLEGNDYIYYLPDELDYLTNIVLYLVKTPDLYLELYAWWVTVNAMIINTTSDIVEFIYVQSLPFSKSTTVRSRSLECASLIVEFMGVAVSYGIADKMFLNSTKPKVDQMLSDIKDAFVDRVNSIHWMDESTKIATLEKSDEMISFIGFPEWLLNKTAMEVYYSNITINNDTYLENMMSIIKLYTPYRLESLREENERTWRTEPTTVNAYNYFGDNSINVPMAILSFPMYQLGLEVLNYGAIGSILGHELTHGFDNTGRKFDKYGNYRQWWSNDTIQVFEQKAECFRTQYNNFTLPNIETNINGQTTLGENLADNGGLHHAYLAYKKFIKKHGQEERLPGLEQYTHDQLFFIAFGSIWCESRSDESLLEQIKSDEHCPNEIRVLGTLQNSHEFADAFSCPLGSGMNPDRKRCRIW